MAPKDRDHQLLRIEHRELEQQSQVSVIDIVNDSTEGRFLQGKDVKIVANVVIPAMMR